VIDEPVMVAGDRRLVAGVFGRSLPTVLTTAG
jgi:hypothetical protein